MADLGQLMVRVGAEIDPSLAGSFDTVTGKLSDIADHAGAAGDAFAQATAKVSDLIAPVTAAAAAAGTLDEQLQALYAQGMSAGEALAHLDSSAASSVSAIANLDGVAGALGETTLPKVAQGLDDTKHSADGAGESIHAVTELLKELAGGYLTFEGLKAAAEHATEAYGELQKAQIALGALLGDNNQANEAIDSIKRLADQLGITEGSAISAQQKLVALQVPLKDIPGIVEAVANGATAMNADFDTAAQRFDQIVLSGALMARSLVSLGLSVEDVGKAMGLTADTPAKQIMQAFKDIGDASDRADVLATALLAKFPDLASKAADGVEGSWNRIKNASTEAWQKIGEGVDGFKGLTEIAGSAIKGLEVDLIALLLPIRAVVDAVILTGQTLYSVFSGTLKGAIDIARNDYAAAAQDFAGIETGVKDAWAGFVHEVSQDWQTTASAISGLLNDTEQSVRGTVPKITGHVNELSDAFKLAENALVQVSNATDALLNKFPTTYATYVQSLSAGGQQATAILKSIADEINKATDAMATLEMTPSQLQQMQSWIDKLEAMRQTAKTFVADDAFGKLGEKLNELVQKYPQQFSEMSGATQDWALAVINSTATANAAIEKVSAATAFEQQLKDLAAADAAWQKLGITMATAWEQGKDAMTTSTSKILSEIGAFGDPMVTQIKEIDKNWVDVAASITNAGAQQALVFTALKALKIDDVGADQQRITAMQTVLGLMQQQGYPQSEILAMEQKIAQAQIDVNQQTGASAGATLQWAIALQQAKDQQDAIKASAMALVNVYQDIRTAVMSAFQNVTGSLVKDLFGGIDNSALDQQIADLKSQLADTTAAWNQTQQDIAAQMAQATADNKAQLQTQLQDLQTQLDQKTQAYNDYVANYNQQLAAMQQASADQTAQEVQALKDSLQQKQDAYTQFYQNTTEQIDTLTQTEKDNLASTIENLQSSLANETENYDIFVQDVNTKLGRIGESLSDNIASRTTQANRAIQDNQTQLQRDREDTATRIQRLQAAETASNKSSTEQQIADLKTALARKEEDSKTFIQRQMDDLATYTQQAKEQAQQQTDDLKAQLAQRTEDYTEYVANNQKQQEDATAKAKGQLQRQIEDLKDALWRQGQALYTAKLDTEQKIQEVTDKNADALAKQEAALKASLDKQTAAYDAAKTTIEDQMKDVTTKAGEQLKKQEDALQKSLDKQAAAYQKYVDGINGYTDAQGVYHEGQLDKIKDKYKTVWGDIATGLTTIGETMLTNITTAFFTPVAKKVADFIGGLLGGLTSVSTSFSDMASANGAIADFNKAVSDAGDAFSKMTSDAVTGIGQIDTAISGVAPAAGGAASGASGATSAIGQVTSSLLSSISSIVGMVTGAISAVTGIISVFQNMHQETTLKAIEHETARMAIYLGDQAGNNIQFYTGKTFEWLGYIRTDMNASLGSIFTDLDFIKQWGVKDLDAISSNTYWSLQKLQEIDNKTGAAGGTEIGQLSWMQTALQNINNNLVALAVNEFAWYQQALININNNTLAAATKLEGILELFQTGNAKISGALGASGSSAVDPKAFADLATYIGANFSNLEGWLFNAFGKSMALPALPAMPAIPSFGMPVGNAGGNTPAAVTQMSNSIGGDHVNIYMTNTFPLGKPDDATIQRIGDALVSRLRIRGGPKMAL